MPHRRAYLVGRRVVRNPNFWPTTMLVSLLISLVLMGYIVWIATSEAAAREARIQSENRAAVSVCFERNAQGRAAERFFEVMEVILQNQITSAQAAIQTTEDDATFQTVLARATTALDDLRSFQQLMRDTTPTRRECLMLAEQLDVRLSQ